MKKIKPLKSLDIIAIAAIVVLGLVLLVRGGLIHFKFQSGKTEGTFMYSASSNAK